MRPEDHELFVPESSLKKSQADNERLRTIIKEAEHKGVGTCCPWCGAHWLPQPDGGDHSLHCRAFTTDGVVK